MPYKDKTVEKEYFAKRYLKNRENRLEANKQNYLKNKEAYLKRSRKAHLKNTYGLSLEEYQNLVLKQNNRCAICFKEETAKDKTGKLKPLCVDHCHTTGKVRALLCNNCNCLLGFSNDKQEILFAAINYLKQYD